MGKRKLADVKLFRPYVIENMSESEIRKEYSRLRSIANKRIGRMGEQGLTEMGKFPTISDIEKSNRADVGSELARVSAWVSDPRHTVSGTKEHLDVVRQSLVDRGYGSLVSDYKSVLEVIRFLDSVSQDYNSKLYSSGDVLDVLEEGERLNIPEKKLQENFGLFMDNLDKMENVKPSKNGREFSQKRINTLKKKWNA